MPNNAFAARKVAEDRLKTQAAIASEYAGKVYGLEVLQKPVNNVSNNSTRFIIVTKDVYKRQQSGVQKLKPDNSSGRKGSTGRTFRRRKNNAVQPDPAFL